MFLARLCRAGRACAPACAHVRMSACADSETGVSGREPVENLFEHNQERRHKLPQGGVHWYIIRRTRMHLHVYACAFRVAANPSAAQSACAHLSPLRGEGGVFRDV